MRLAYFSLVLALAAACNRGEQSGAAPTQNANPSGTQEAAAPAAGTNAAPAAAAAVGRDQSAYLLYAAIMVKQPSDDRKIKNANGKEETNWLATLFRGEQVTLLKQDGDWSQVSASDGKEGWIKSTALLPGDGVSVATVLEDVKTFTRPDFLAPSKTVIAPGSLLYVTKKSKDETFSEVNFSGTSAVWLESGKLVADNREVSAARVVSRARSLDERKDEQAKQYWEVAKSQFGDTQVVQKTMAAPAATDAAAAPAAAAGTAPAAAPAAAPADSGTQNQ